MDGVPVSSATSTEPTSGSGVGRRRGEVPVRAGLRWAADHRLVLGVGLIAAGPVIVSTVRALLDGWTPVFDDGVMATHAFDVFSAHSPLVGARSDASVTNVGSVFSPGPMLFWLLALQAHLLGDWSFPVTIGLLNTASIVGVVTLARRRGGCAFMWTTAIALAAMCRSLPEEVLHQVDNSRAGLLPFMLLLFLAWSVACGEYRRVLVLLVLVGSFVIQIHFSVAVPALAVLLTTALVAVARFLVVRRGYGAIASGGDQRPWLLGALVAALACWSGPLLDQVLHRPGNFVLIWRTATAHQRTVGITTGWHALVRTVGIPPWWLRAPPTNLRGWPVGLVGGGRFWELVFAPSSLAVFSCLLILMGLLVVVVLGVRRRRGDVVMGAILALVLAASVVMLTASTPPRLLSSLDYGLRWTSPAGMFTWLVLGWSLATLLRPTRWRAVRALRNLTPTRGRIFTPLLGLSITALVAILVTTQQGSDTYQWSYRPVRALVSRLGVRVPRNGTVLIFPSSSLSGYLLDASIIYGLRRQGFHVVTHDTNIAKKLGPYYSELEPHANVLLVDDGNLGSRPGGRMIVRVPVPGARSANEGKPSRISVWLLPSVAGRASVCPPGPPASTAGPTPSPLRIVPNQVAGSIDHSQILGDSVRFCGWAANLKDHRVADSVQLYAGGRFLGAVRPTVPRPDVLHARGPLSGTPGFSLRLPTSVLEHGQRKAAVQLFGIERGVASPLPFACQGQSHDFGC